LDICVIGGQNNPNRFNGPVQTVPLENFFTKAPTDLHSHLSDYIYYNVSELFDRSFPLLLDCEFLEAGTPCHSSLSTIAQCSVIRNKMFIKFNREFSVNMQILWGRLLLKPACNAGFSW
jgi:hypothetical protein